MNTEKMLGFAYKMRDVYEKAVLKNELKFTEEQIKGLRSEQHNVYLEEYSEILRMICELENEIAFNLAKSSGRKKETKRTSCAKKFIKVNQYNNIFDGYKSLDDGRIVLCNGYGLFVGDSIIGIPETSRPNDFNLSILANFDDDRLTNEITLNSDDVAVIKKRLIEGHSKTGKKKARDIIDAHCNDGVVLWKGKSGVVAFNADYILYALGMTGADSWNVKFGGRTNGCIISGENGMCFTLPVRINTDDEQRVDKEA